MIRDNHKFKALLDESYVWPAHFPFKFIIAPHYVDELKELLNDAELSLRHSKNGKYVSVSAEMKLSSSEEVIYIYEKVSQIKDIIAL
jgi:putative lipoic acid-binding regulatory protein